MEELPLRVDGAHTRLQSVAEHDKGIVVEQLGYGVEIVAIVLVEGINYLHVVVLQFHEEQGNAVDIAHNVGPSMIERTIHPHFPDTKELVLLWRIEVDDLGLYLLCLTIGLRAFHWDTVAYQLIFLLVNLHQRLTTDMLCHAVDAFL